MTNAGNRHSLREFFPVHELVEVADDDYAFFIKNDLLVGFLDEAYGTVDRNRHSAENRLFCYNNPVQIIARFIRFQ